MVYYVQYKYHIQFHFCCQQVLWQQICVINTMKWSSQNSLDMWNCSSISTHKLSQYDVPPALIGQSGKVVASVNCLNWLRKIPSHWPLPKISFIALKWINPIYIQHQCHLDYGWFRALHWKEKGVIWKNIAVD